MLMFLFLLDDKDKKRNEFIDVLIEKYNKQIYNHIYSMIYLKSKDEINYCLNGIYIAAFKNYNKIKNYKDLLPWLLRVAANITITENRKYMIRGKHQVHINSETEDLINNIPDSSISTDEKVVNEIVYNDYIKNNRADEILSSLSPEELKLYKLKYDEKLADAEIAVIMNIPLNTVKTKIRRLRNKIERMVYDENDKD